MIRLVVTVNPNHASPQKLRARFALALRQTIAQALIAGRIEPDHAEELWRVVPNPERV